MKAVLRSSVIALMVLAGYAALATPVTPPTTSTAGPFSQGMPKPAGAGR